jgi:hypothetical protein
MVAFSRFHCAPILRNPRRRASGAPLREEARNSSCVLVIVAVVLKTTMQLLPIKDNLKVVEELGTVTSLALIAVRSLA